MPKGSVISIPDAQAMTAAFRAEHAKYNISATFDKALFTDMMADTNIEFIRVYFGMYEGPDGLDLTALITAVKSNEEDVLSHNVIEFGDHINPNPL